jgi:hypothetical protein
VARTARGLEPILASGSVLKRMIHGEKWARLPTNPLKRHFGRAKLKGCEVWRGGLGGLRQTGYCADVIEDASLVEDYGNIRPKYCAVLLTIANFSQNCWMKF